ncbi:uncharacterized protein TNCV_2216841 [Trichonephila clavipes]|nr:uncharacterized protein TNCV_2216841 [Trichonephila clavipes]
MVFLRSLLPTLHCRRVAGVSPFLSISWWYLSSVSLKRICCRIRATDKGCWVYPLNLRPDTVALYSGCTPGKHRAWFLLDERHPASLVRLRGGWRHSRMKVFTSTYGTNAAVPGEMPRKSPFVVHKAIIGIGEEPKSIKKLRSGYLLIETTTALQSKSFLLAKTFLDFPLSVNPQRSLNSCGGPSSNQIFCVPMKQKSWKDFLARVLPRSEELQ